MKHRTRLFISVAGMIGVVLLVFSLQRQFGYPIGHYRAMPPGTPLWWSLVVACAAATLILLLSVVLKSVMEIVRERRSGARLRG
jgi:ABC-type Fe3+ transport system permease subunit